MFIIYEQIKVNKARAPKSEKCRRWRFQRRIREEESNPNHIQPAKKALKAAKAAKKLIEIGELRRKKTGTKSKIEISESSSSDESDSIELKPENEVKIIHVPLEMFKPDKVNPSKHRYSRKF